MPRTRPWGSSKRPATGQSGSSATRRRVRPPKLSIALTRGSRRTAHLITSALCARRVWRFQKPRPAAAEAGRTAPNWLLLRLDLDVATLDVAGPGVAVVGAADQLDGEAVPGDLCLGAARLALVEHLDHELALL